MRTLSGPSRAGQPARGPERRGVDRAGGPGPDGGILRHGGGRSGEGRRAGGGAGRAVATRRGLALPGPVSRLGRMLPPSEPRLPLATGGPPLGHGGPWRAGPPISRPTRHHGESAHPSSYHDLLLIFRRSVHLIFSCLASPLCALQCTSGSRRYNLRIEGCPRRTTEVAVESRGPVQRVRSGKQQRLGYKISNDGYTPKSRMR